jgi:hypothetical protein
MAARAPCRAGLLRPAPGGWAVALLLLVALAVLSACARQPEPAADDTVGRALRPFEDIPWPRPLARLGLPSDRDYVVLAHVAPLNPIDLSEPEATRRTLERAIFDIPSQVAGKTSIGHLIVGWQCGGVQGITSQTGETSGQGLRMAVQGWGVSAVLSTFLDGRLTTAHQTSWRHLTMLDTGRGSVLAVEVDRADCERLRRRLVDYIEHPSRPATRFGMLLDPDAYEGGGCLSFGLWLAAQAGVLAEARPAMNRRVTIRAPIVGRLAAPFPGVEPYIPPGLPEVERVVTLAELRRGPWDAGPVLDEIELVDGELILAAVTALRAGAGARPGWREARVLPRTDPGVARAIAAASAYAAAFPVRRLADAEGVSAVVLERR